MSGGSRRRVLVQRRGAVVFMAVPSLGIFVELSWREALHLGSGLMHASVHAAEAARVPKVGYQAAVEQLTASVDACDEAHS